MLSLMATIQGSILILLMPIENWGSMFQFAFFLTRNRARKFLKIAFNWLGVLWKECTCVLGKQNFPFSLYRPQCLGWGDSSTNLLCMNRGCGRSVGDRRCWSLWGKHSLGFTSPRAASMWCERAGNTHGLPWLLWWFTVGITRHAAFELGT